MPNQTNALSAWIGGFLRQHGGFLLNTLISIICAFGAVALADHNAAVREAQHDKKSDEAAYVTEYRRATDRFDSVAQTYAGMILTSGQVDPKAKAELLSNLLEQNRTIERAEAVLPKEKRKTAVAYRDALVVLSQRVQDVSGVEDMAPYWQSLNDVLVLRKSLDQDFDQVAKG